MSLLDVNNLHTVLNTPAGQVQAVNTVLFSLQAGETLALLGESGCGKSMTALSLMRLLPEGVGEILDGEVCLAGQDLLELPETQMQKIRGRHVGMIFQEPMTALNPVLTVEQQMAEVLKLHFKMAKSKRTQRCLDLLDEVGIADPKRCLKAYPHELSGGMKQRVGIAIALAGDPKLLIADEPTTALDVTIQGQILALLKRVQKKHGMGLLLITHNLAVVKKVADRVAVMYAGHIVETAQRDALFTSPKHPYTKRLFASLPAGHRRGQPLQTISGRVPALTQSFKGCRFADRCPFAWQRCFEQPPKIYQIDQSRARCHLYDPNEYQRLKKAQQEHAPQAPQDAEQARNGAPILQLRDLKVHFPIKKGVFKRTVGEVKAVNGVTLAIAKGQTMALVGESGCGKTTLSRAIVQLEAPTAGDVLFANRSIFGVNKAELARLRQNIQIIFQDPYGSMNPRMTIFDIVKEGLNVAGERLSAAQSQRRVVELLQEVGLGAEALARFPHEFSGGQRQRIAIARALAAQPKLIICDEPTSALDVSVQAQVLNMLQGLQQKHDLTYLFISHDMAVVRHIADALAVMYKGQIVEQGEAEQVFNHPKHQYTQKLLAAAPSV